MNICILYQYGGGFQVQAQNSTCSSKWLSSTTRHFIGTKGYATNEKTLISKECTREKIDGNIKSRNYQFRASG